MEGSGEGLCRGPVQMGSGCSPLSVDQGAAVDLSESVHCNKQP